MKSDNTNDLLIKAALNARGNAYAPYSEFKVGAALADKKGNIYLGTNVEASSYGLTVCAERNAVGAAVVAGAREFDSIVVASDKGVSPCGACRQVIYDICGDIDVILVNEQGEIVSKTTAGKLLPNAFSDKDLEK